VTASAPWRQIGGVAVAGGVRWLAARLLRTAPPGGRDRWTRANHAGRPVTLLEGPEYVLGATAGSLLSGSGAGAVAVVAAGVVGALDDLAGDASSRGLRGHLAALRRGQVTTGVVKVVGLGVTGAVAAALTDAGQRHSLAERPLSRLADVVVAAGVVAGTANLVNLLDLRPGRALKVTSMIAAPLALAGSRAAPAALGSALASLGDDLKGVSMLGDTGASAAGALLGVALLEQLGRRGRLAALGVLTALTLASETVSFTRVIESTPVLRELDGWGRASMAGEGLA
jgi:UDP-N-acetylmuramyl pentapeptide phosphotransferase/UDP-N-acetylglucosamine-1-phosphate transferase